HGGGHDVRLTFGFKRGTSLHLHSTRARQTEPKRDDITDPSSSSHCEDGGRAVVLASRPAKHGRCWRHLTLRIVSRVTIVASFRLPVRARLPAALQTSAQHGAWRNRRWRRFAPNAIVVGTAAGTAPNHLPAVPAALRFQQHRQRPTASTETV